MPATAASCPSTCLGISLIQRTLPALCCQPMRELTVRSRCSRFTPSSWGAPPSSRTCYRLQTRCRPQHRCTEFRPLLTPEPSSLISPSLHFSPLCTPIRPLGPQGSLELAARVPRTAAASSSSRGTGLTASRNHYTAKRSSVTSC